jgi:iron(III) transport system ATP-binding protein
MELAHSIAVLDSGHVAQIGPPREIYEQPATRYVADFIGTINEVGGTVVAVRPDGTGTVDTSVGRLEVTMAEREAGPGDRVCVLWRPERTRVHRERPSAGTTCWRGVVEASFFSGAHTEHVVAVEGVGDQRVWRPDPETIPDGTPVWVEVAARDLRALGEVPTAAERGEDQEGTG